ncbi:MAG TPA: hypothetical protein VEC37_00765 [Bacillota bacterium]|nr:hypothetical protein [Bacillota bacterium]
MGEKYRVDKNSRFAWSNEQNDYQKWFPVFQHLSLKPRRFFCKGDIAFICTAEGWFRLSRSKYSKEELNWLRSILEYLEERSFKNWAVPWQHTVIWEESDCCYLIQPWYFSQESFQTGDPATLERMAEILAELYRCGKDYRENRGLGVFRERWSTVATGWQEQLVMLQSFKEELYHEKMHKDLNGMRKDTEELLTECLKCWEAGMSSLFEHQYHLGVLGHGQLLAKYIVWRENDYFLLNWEHIAFQPKIADLASLIEDVGYWEPEWIIYFINQYTKLQPLWPEEYQALKAMLSYPKQLIRLFQDNSGKAIENKMWKEADKELKRKGRCLDKVWREISSEKTRWAWGKDYTIPKSRETGRISMVLSPVESWGGLSNERADSLINVKTEEKVPSDIWQRLINPEGDRVLSGGEGGFVRTTSNVNSIKPEFDEEPVPIRLDALVSSEGEKADIAVNALEELIKATPDEKETAVEGCTPQTINEKESFPKKANQNEVLNWSGFPKPMK